MHGQLMGELEVSCPVTNPPDLPFGGRYPSRCDRIRLMEPASYQFHVKEVSTSLKKVDIKLLGENCS